MSGRIREDDINEVRERTSIVDVISDYVTLKKAGRTYKGLCPFHKEKTPSFIVDTERQLWHCFGCGEGGNAYTFLMKMEHLDFPETVRVFAERIGYELHYEGTNASDFRARKSERERLLEAVRLACEYYHYVLIKTDTGSQARKYLKARGIEESSIAGFMLGMAPQRWDGLLQWLTKKGYQEQELMKAGLVLRGERGQSSLYDRFRGRVMFPIRNLRGEAVGFGGRVINEGEPKYLNSPESEIFHKGSLLYGLYEHKADIVQSGEAVVVEGYTDVILPHQRQMGNLVATLGTALGEEHIRLLSRFCSRIVMLFDGDDAGLAAAQRSLEFVDATAADIYIAVLPQGNDPADFVSLNDGEALKDIIAGARPVVDHCLDRIAKKYDTKSSAGKLKALGEMVFVLAKLASPLARDEYARKISQRFDVSYDAVMAEIRKRESGSTAPVGVKTGSVHMSWPAAELELLRALVQYPKEGRSFVEQIDRSLIANAAMADALGLIAKAIGAERSAMPAEIVDALAAARIDEDLVKKITVPVEAEEPEFYIDSLIKRINTEKVETEIEILRKRLVEADPDSDDYDKLFHELVALETIKRRS